MGEWVGNPIEFRLIGHPWGGFYLGALIWGTELLFKEGPLD